MVLEFRHNKYESIYTVDNCRQGNGALFVKASAAIAVPNDLIIYTIVLNTRDTSGQRTDRHANW